ncbi:MAG: (deoxy)nucleoside triphosphate pyrophosphohydrolase [Nesterenkonia sp.]|nr:(deoxy)nucleoside triphosphate pyrophosphohydrolase [Nesterenkonia sp.]
MIVVVAGAILRSTDTSVQELLIARRTAPESLAGLWEFPGGKLEPGEDPRVGAVRELAEELGVDVVLGEELTSPTVPEFEAGHGWRLNDEAVMRLFLGRLRDDSPEPQALADHDRVVWAPVGCSLLRYPWIPADLPIVEALIRALTGRPAQKQ